MRRIVLLAVFFMGILGVTYGQEVPDSLIPVLHVTTVDGEMPTCEVTQAPEGCIGVTITGNDYVPGRMVMTFEGDTLYDSQEYEKGVSGMRIKIRGNSTGAYLAQHPYKIKLSKKDDLLLRGDKVYRHKEWVLLSMYTWNVRMSNQESNTLNIAGTVLSRLMGMEWVPSYRFVHLVINGQYQGMYYLMETVDRGNSRIDISETGFLIEHDVFWWKEDVYFKTRRQRAATAFTFKYPDDSNVTDSTLQAVKGYMEDFEEALYSGGDIGAYIDLTSFARWILIHDLLGTDDAAGSNRFLYKNDLDEGDPLSSKLMMGTLWDFDSSFRSDSWSYLHTTDWFYYPLLFGRSDFQQAYIDLWRSVRVSLPEAIESGIEEVWQAYGPLFDPSMAIHRTVYPNEGKNDFRSQLDEIQQKLMERLRLLDRLMEELESSVQHPVESGNILSITNMAGYKIKPAGIHRLPAGIYLVTYSGSGTKKLLVRSRR